MKRLRVLCPQEYHGVTMVVVECTRCSQGWNRATQRCNIPIGCEHLPMEPAIPDCPIADRCQHQLQTPTPCAVRARGLVCESALAFAGDPQPENHPLGFNAQVCA